MAHTVILAGKEVFPLVLGTVPFGSDMTEKDAFHLMDAFAQAGGNMLDTANIYGYTQQGFSRSERTVAAWLKASGAPMLLATKGAHPHPGKPESRVRPECIERDVLLSGDEFQRRIDLYWLHRDDETVPVSQLMDALFAQQDAGRIGAIGGSNWRAGRIEEANAYAASKGRTGFVGAQNQYALCMPREKTDSTIEWFSDLQDGPFYAGEGLALYAFTAQSRGYVGKVAAGADLGRAEIFDTPQNRERALACKRIAGELGASPNGVALAYLLHRPFACLPVVGPKTLEQLEDSLSAARIALTGGQIEALEAK